MDHDPTPPFTLAQQAATWLARQAARETFPVLCPVSSTLPWPYYPELEPYSIGAYSPWPPTPHQQAMDAAAIAGMPIRQSITAVSGWRPGRQEGDPMPFLGPQIGIHDITAEHALAEVLRELRQRDHAYPRLIAQDSLSESRAIAQYRALLKVLAIVQDATQAETRQIPLFVREETR